MKKITVIIIVCAGFTLGAIVGIGASSYYWSRLTGFQIVATSLGSVSTAYAPLKLLKNNQTQEATKVLEAELDSSMQNLELISATLNRPDILTNSVVLDAKTLK
jgi:hypothetical protein